MYLAKYYPVSTHANGLVYLQKALRAFFVAKSLITS